MVRERTIQLTQAGKAKLEEELAYLINTKRAELADRILESNEHGDVSDNSESESAKEELVVTESRITELQQMLERAEVIEHPSNDRVALGSVVTIRGDDGVEETWTIVDHVEADTRDGSISTESPVGKILLDKRAGECISVKTPGGMIEYTVVR
jgi:transcription elongation factor GreA